MEENKDKYYVCIDIGGTAIKYALAKQNGKLLDKQSMPTEAKIFGGKGIVDKIKSIVKSYRKDFLLEGVAISTAGIVDAKKGAIIYALPEAIPGYSGMQLKSIVEEEFKIPCCVENDVNCAALGEMWLGAGKEKLNILSQTTSSSSFSLPSLFCITVGTSIGGCAIFQGQLIRGVSSAAGEIANMRISGGLLHELASTTKLVKDVAKAKAVPEDELNGEIIFEWAKRGDEAAKSAIAELIEHLADGIANIAAVFNPEMFILGGGIMVQEAYLRPLINSAVKERVFATVYKDTEITFAKLGNDAGLLGALYNFLNCIS